MNLSAEVREDAFSKVRCFGDNRFEVIQSCMIANELGFVGKVLDVIQEAFGSIGRVEVR